MLGKGLTHVSHSLLRLSRDLLFRNPAWLWLLTALLIFVPLLEGGTTHIAVMIIRLMVLLLATIYLAQGIQQGCFVWPALRADVPVVGYLVLAITATIASPYTHQSLQWLIVLLTYAALLYFIVFFVTQWDYVMKLLAVVVTVGIMEAAWAVVQGGLYGALRPTGTFFNPNFLGGYLAAVATVLAGVLCYARIGRPRHERTSTHWDRLTGLIWITGCRRRAKLAVICGALFALSFLLVAMMWTSSRGATLSLLVGLLLVVGLRYGRYGLALILVLVVAVLVVPNPLRSRVIAEHTSNPVGYARLQMWQQAVRAMIDHPFGVGFGLYQYVSPRYAFPIEGQIAKYGKLAQTPHSEYLQMGVELGVASVAVFCWGVFIVGRTAVSVLRCRLRRWQRGILVGLTGAVAGILVHAAVDSNLHEPAIAILLAVFVGLIFVAERLSRRRAVAERTLTVRPKWFWLVAGSAVVVFCAIVIVRLGLAWMAYEQGVRAQDAQNVPLAIERYRTAIDLDPGKALYHNALASAYFRIFQSTGNQTAAEAAAAVLQSAIERNPIDGRLYSLLGFVYASLASSPLASESPSRKPIWLQVAAQAYERALELEPYSAFDRLALAKVYLALGQREAAEQRVLEAVSLEPNFLPGREWLILFYLQSGKPDAVGLAQREYQEIVNRQQRFRGWTKDRLEAQYLKADVAALASRLEQAATRKT